MTSKVFLEEYAAKKLIKPEKIGLDQVVKVIRSAEKDLWVSERLLSIDEGHAYETAYAAMLHAGRAFVFVKGFRPTTHFQHKTVVGFASHFLGDKHKALLEKFDYMRKKRNNFIYEPWKVNISLTDAKGALASAREFVNIVKEEIKRGLPQKHFKF